MRSLNALIALSLVLVAQTAWAGAWLDPAANPPDAVLSNYRNSIAMQDDFISGVSTSGQIGRLGWAAIGGITTAIDSEVNHPGFFRRSTGTVINTLTTLHLYNGVASAWFSPAIFDVIWVIRLNESDTNTQWRIGSISSYSSNPPNFGAYFEKLDADTNWWFVTRNSGTQTRTDTGIAVTPGAWINLKIKMTTTIVTAYINDSLVATHTTNIPTQHHVSIQGINSAAAAKTIDIDYCEIVITNLVR